jgi:acyl-CoA thioesterase I
MFRILRALLFVGVFGLLANGATQAQATAQAKQARHILVVGDSLSAEYGLARGMGWVALLEQRLAEQKINAKITNASISGETTAGGVQRIDKLIADHKPTHVILELGSNDALRGLPLATMEANLRRMVDAAQAIKADVLILGMQLPPNYGADFTGRFAAVFKTVADSEKVELVPFFLKNVGDVAHALDLFQADRIHPNEKAQPIMLNNVWPKLQPLLK